MALLEIDDLVYTYPDGTLALRGLSLQVECGQRVGLVGPNGSGKSTLLMCIMGLTFGRGTVRIDGTMLTAQSVDAIRGRVGLVFQSADEQLFMPTLRDDLAFGPINLGCVVSEVTQRVDDAAEVMGLSLMLDRPPHHLSMGQRRNAAIAGVLAMRPEMLLMDEPASNLDPRSRRRLIDVLAGLGTTMLIASHDLAMVGGLCPRVVVVDQGRVVADGPSGDILHDAALMEQHGLEAWHDSRS